MSFLHYVRNVDKVTKNVLKKTLQRTSQQCYVVMIGKFYKMTNQCTINWQMIILLLHVSALLCHPQGARSQYLAKLHKYVNVFNVQVTVRHDKFL